MNVLLIINTGTPDGPDRKSVSRYLSEFLNDPMVMDMPLITRKILVNLIIVPFRSSHSSELYRRLWTDEGSPLLLNLKRLSEKLQSGLPGWKVIGAMRYGNPSLEKILDELGRHAVNKLTILPLYPQYASSTTGSVNAAVKRSLSVWKQQPRLNLIEPFYSDPGFISVFAKKIRERRPEDFDHVLFSFHGLPVKHIRKIHPERNYSNCICEKILPEYGAGCYRAQCYETSRLLAGALELKEGSWSVSFQSRLSEKWIRPFTEDVLKNLAAYSKKKVLVAAPSFTADCLETLVEIKQTCRKLFITAGGEELELCESLNYDDDWVEAIIGMTNEWHGLQIVNPRQR